MALFKSGTASVAEFAETLRNSTGAAAEMAERQLDNLAGDVTVLGSAWEGLSITVGKLFIPVLRRVTQTVSSVVTGLDKIAQHPIGAFLLKLLATASAAVIGITAFSGAMWGVSKVAPIILKTLAPLKAAILGLGWPILAVIAVVAGLYAAYKTNFGGIADVVNRWYNNIRLVVSGVIAVFESLTGATGTIRGELAKEIKAAGLEGFVTTVSKVVYRVKAFFKGLWEALDFSPAVAALTPAILKIREIFDKLSAVFARLFGSEVTSAASTFEKFGSVLGKVASVILEVWGTAVSVVVNSLGMLTNGVLFVVSIFTGDMPGAADAFRGFVDGIGEGFAMIGDLFGVGDAIRSAWDSVMAFLDGINLFESGAKLMTTFAEGIKSMLMAPYEAVSGALQGIRNLLPFSDAKEGPLSQLTLSGTRMMTTLAEGVAGGAGTLKERFTGILGGISKGMGDWWDGLFSGDAPKIAPELPPVPVPEKDQARARERGANGAPAGNTYTFHITANLPNVKDGKDFMQSLNDLVNDYGGGFAPA
jgi:phage-related protein